MIVPMADRPHHRAHIAPVARLLGIDSLYMERAIAGPDDVALVASYGDLPFVRRARFRRIILMQHGAGQSYGGDSRTARHPCYAGGDDNDDVGLFLTPNQHSANRWRERYPQASVEVVGCPILDELPSRAVDMDTATIVEKASLVVAVSFHWNYHGMPETRSAFDWYSKAVVDLSRKSPSSATVTRGARTCPTGTAPTASSTCRTSSRSAGGPTCTPATTRPRCMSSHRRAGRWSCSMRRGTGGGEPRPALPGRASTIRRLNIFPSRTSFRGSANVSVPSALSRPYVGTKAATSSTPTGAGAAHRAADAIAAMGWGRR